MAFGALIDSSFLNLKAETCRILVEREGYASTTFSPNVQEYNVERGARQDGLQSKRSSLLGRSTFAVEDATLMTELQKIPSQGPREHRVTIERAGTTRFLGYCVPDATSTPVNTEETRTVTIRAKDRLKGLGTDWLDNGSPYLGQGYLPYNTIIADILAKLALSLPIHVVTDIRPSTLSASDDPLSIEAPPEAFYRSDSGANVRPETRAQVLDSLLQSLNLQIVQKDGVWALNEPGAFESGTDVDVWEYDSSGTFQQQTTRSAYVDITDEAWEHPDDSVGGKQAVREARVTFQHNVDKFLPLNGSFEERDGDKPKDWFFYENTVQRTFPDPPLFDNAEDDKIIEGDWGIRIEGQKAPAGTAPGDLYQYANDWAEKKVTTDFTTARREQLVTSAEDLTLRIQAKFTVSTNTDANPNETKIYWGLRGEKTESGTVYYYVNGVGWKTEANVTEKERRNEIFLGDLASHPDTDISPIDRSFDIPPPPEAIDPYVQVFQIVSVPDSSSADAYALLVNYDALELRRKAGSEQPFTTHRVWDQSVEEGKKMTLESRLGDGPWAESDGDIWDSNSDNTDGWQILGEAGEYAHSRLLARELIRLRRTSRQTKRVNLVQPTNEPQADRALLFDGDRYWPLFIKEVQPGDQYDVLMMELKKDAAPGSYEILPGDGETVASQEADPNAQETSSAPSAEDTGTTGAVDTWQDRTGNVTFESSDFGDGLKLDTNTSPPTAVIEPGDFAGNALTDDGSDNLAVATDGIGVDELDLSISPTWTGEHFFDLPSNVAPIQNGVLTIGSGTAGGTVVPSIKSAPDATNTAALGLIAQSQSAGTGFGRAAIILQGEEGDSTRLADSEAIVAFQNTTDIEAVMTGDGSLGLFGVSGPSYSLETAGRIGRAYTEGLFGAGYILDPNIDGTGLSYFEIDKLRVRDTLRAHIFKKDIVRATNALLYVSDASSTSEDVTSPSTTGTQFTIYVEAQVFTVGDEIQFKDEVDGNILSVIATVDANVGSTTRNSQTVYEYTVTLNSGTDVTIPGGSLVVRTSGARMLLDAATADAPVQTLWNQNGNRRAALGNLDGQYGFGATTFGLAAGDPSGEHITIEPGNGVRIISGSDVLAQLSGTSLSLGVGGQIQFDPTATPEAKIQGTLEMNGGEIRNVDSDYFLDNEGLTLRPNDSQIQARQIDWEDSSSNELARVSADGAYDGVQSQSDATLSLLGGFNILLQLDGRTGSFQMREFNLDATDAAFLFRGGQVEFQTPTAGDQFIFFTTGGAAVPYIDMETMDDGINEPGAPPTGKMRIFISQEDGASGADTLKIGFKEPAGNVTFVNP